MILSICRLGSEVISAYQELHQPVLDFQDIFLKASALLVSMEDTPKAYIFEACKLIC